jgi:hypothetical protein
MDKWKISTAILIFLIMGLLGLKYYQDNQTYDLFGMEVEKAVLDDAVEHFGNDPFVICDSEVLNKCVRIKKIS